MKLNEIVWKVGIVVSSSSGLFICEIPWFLLQSLISVACQRLKTAKHFSSSKHLWSSLVSRPSSRLVNDALVNSLDVAGVNLNRALKESHKHESRLPPYGLDAIGPKWRTHSNLRSLLLHEPRSATTPSLQLPGNSWWVKREIFGPIKKYMASPRRQWQVRAGLLFPELHLNIFILFYT